MKITAARITPAMAATAIVVVDKGRDFAGLFLIAGEAEGCGAGGGVTTGVGFIGAIDGGGTTLLCAILLCATSVCGTSVLGAFVCLTASTAGGFTAFVGGATLAGGTFVTGTFVGGTSATLAGRTS